MSEKNRLQAQRPCENAPLFLPAPLKGGGLLWFLGFMGEHFEGYTADLVGKSKGGD